MLERNCRTPRWLLCCALVPMLAGCTMLTPEWHPRRASASQCPENTMHSCVIDNYGKRCGCVAKGEVEAILRSRR